MSLPTDEADLRALDARCSDPLSAISKRTVALLSALPLEDKLAYMHNCSVLDLGNVVRLLLLAGVSPDAGMDSVFLVVAACSGSSRALKALLDGGANHALTDENGVTALYIVARNGHLESLKILLAAGASPHVADSARCTPLMVACLCHHAACVEVLLPVSDLSQTSVDGNSVLHQSVAVADKECFDLLLPLVSDVDVRTVPAVGLGPLDYGLTALHVASQKGQQPMVKALLKRGADRMARDSRRGCPLHHAAHRGHLSCVVLLLKKPSKMTPAEVDAVQQRGFTALHCAAQEGHEKIAGVLLEAGAWLDAKSLAGDTPLMLAQEFQPDNGALLALLSGAGTSALPGTVCDHCGKTPAQANVNILKACGNCHAARFCGADCAAAAWPGHKKACRARQAEVEAKTKPTTIMNER